MNRPSDVEKLSSDKRLAWRALSTLGTQLFLMDPALSVEEAPSAAGMPTATVTFSIPNGHTLAKGPTFAMGMLSNLHLKRCKPYGPFPFPLLFLFVCSV